MRTITTVHNDMETIFDIFSRLPDGSPLWVESIEGLKKARERLDRLAQLNPGEYFIYSEGIGGVVSRVPEAEQRPDAPHFGQRFVF
ncbi:MAG TPA: hypothetical protein VG322_11495 [Candidatus Acidoferrales bacterium]|nr:hypothetical protein [Candidatus Acidoferrales bacterium]